MAIVDMCKISILALKEDRDDILTRLIKIGMVEITDEIDTPLKKEEAEALLSVDGNGELFELEGHLNDVQAVISSLEEYDTRKKGMLYFGQEITGDDFERISGKKEALKQVIDEILVYNSELSELRSKQNNAENTLNALKPWKDYELPLKVKGTKHTSIIKGTIPSNFSFEKVSEEVYKDNKFVRMERINQDKDEMYLVLLVLNENEDAAVNILKKYGFGKIHIKESDKNPKAQIKELKTAIAGFEKEREIIKEKIEKLSYNISELEIYYDYLLQEKEKSLIKKKMRSTASTVLIEGWTPIALIDKINDEIKTRFTCNIKTENPDKDEERPILLHNRGMAKATELITEMYSLPGHKETDPNLIMAPFYIVFFGIMLGDVGYGLILALLCGLLLWKANLKAGMKKVMSLLFFCGISTIICGLLFGSIFGDAIAVISGKPINTDVLFNPIEFPEKMLIISLALGVLQIFTGIGMKGYNLIKNGNTFDGILDTITLYMFFGGGAMYVLPLLPTINVEAVEPYAKLGGNIFVVGLILILTTSGRQSKKLTGKIFGGLPKIYDLIGFLSDVLSYSRLLSLGLASAVIAQVINQIGSMMGLNNIIGIILFIVVFVVGHIFNLLLGALSAYVHSSRLQYMEFFSKFYKGGGNAFEPFKINTVYTNYLNKNE